MSPVSLSLLLIRNMKTSFKTSTCNPNVSVAIKISSIWTTTLPVQFRHSFIQSLE